MAKDKIKDNESICTSCGKKINDDKETLWNNDAEPYCAKYFREQLD